MQQTHSFSAVEKYDPNMKTKIASSVAKTERREVERSRVGREICIDFVYICVNHYQKS